MLCPAELRGREQDYRCHQPDLSGRDRTSEGGVDRSADRTTLTTGCPRRSGRDRRTHDLAPCIAVIAPADRIATRRLGRRLAEPVTETGASRASQAVQFAVTTIGASPRRLTAAAAGAALTGVDGGVRHEHRRHVDRQHADRRAPGTAAAPAAFATGTAAPTGRARSGSVEERRDTRRTQAPGAATRTSARTAAFATVTAEPADHDRAVQLETTDILHDERDRSAASLSTQARRAALPAGTPTTATTTVMYQQPTAAATTAARRPVLAGQTRGTGCPDQAVVSETDAAATTATWCPARAATAGRPVFARQAALRSGAARITLDLTFAAVASAGRR